MGKKETKNNFPAKEKTAIGRTFKPTGEVLEKGFNVMWGGHRFLDQEVDMLLDGEEVKVMTENDKIVIGRLEKGKYKGKEYWGYQIGIPMKTAGHEWTKEEREELYSGEELYIEDFYSPKTCENFSATASWDDIDHEIVLSFKKDAAEEDEDEDDEEDDEE